jgi:hypothetical protein
MFIVVVLTIEISYAIDLINEQNSDMICLQEIFNTCHWNGAMDWDFKKSKTIPLEISVLGNHDYGEYVTWPSEAHKAQNLKILKLIWSNQLSIVNEWAQIHNKGDDKIALVGVENWGISKASDINNERVYKGRI